MNEYMIEIATREAPRERLDAEWLGLSADTVHRLLRAGVPL